MSALVLSPSVRDSHYVIPCHQKPNSLTVSENAQIRFILRFILLFSLKKHSIRIGRNQLKKLFHPDDMRKRKNTDPRRFFITKEKQQHSLNNIPSKKYKFFSIFSRKYRDIFGKRTYTFSKAGPRPRKQLIINAKNNKKSPKGISNKIICQYPGFCFSTPFITITFSGIGKTVV